MSIDWSICCPSSKFGALSIPQLGTLGGYIPKLNARAFPHGTYSHNTQELTTALPGKEIHDAHTEIK